MAFSIHDNDDTTNWDARTDSFGDEKSDEEASVASATEHQDKAPELNIATEEKKQVKQVRLFFFVVLLVSIIGALFVYFYLALLEQQQFEDKFYDDASKILGSLGNTFDTALGALDSIALLYVTYARSTNQSFPFVTFPDFGIHFLKTMPLTKALITYYLPVVSFEARREWEAYGAGNNTNARSWILPTLRLQETWDKFPGPKPQNYNYTTEDVVWGNFGLVPYDMPRENSLDVHLPEFSTFPLIAEYPCTNYDWYSQMYTDGLTNTMTKRKAILSKPIMIPWPDDPDAIAEANEWCLYFKPFLEPDEDCLEPLSQWYYPVIDSTDEAFVSNADGFPEAYPAKALITTDFYWRGLFRDILPNSSRGLLLLVSNNCIPQSFTYQIDGPTATYRGVRDVHETKYDKITTKTNMVDLNRYRVEDSDYTGLPVDHDDCTFTFQVYPSQEMEDQFKSNNGIIFALSAVALIVLPFLIFLIYDRKVEKQREIIMSNANRSNAIISSLFPSDVRDELYPLMPNNDSIVESKPSRSPIAKLYPETTVLFADIADFTVWSSVRDAFQVFRLLETIYVAFDKIAKRRKVFKVETVGDSYIAVCGLPEPRSDHAVVMVKFAKDIIVEMKRQVLDLEVFLGPGTSSLAIRVGLNSGPTTAGVLRGAKGRFQLFGDTANTAARMESNSRPSNIMCSEQTANILIAAGYQHWVTARSDLVEAKGKGALQCYWCDPVSMNFGADQQPEPESKVATSDDDSTDATTLKRLVNWMTAMFEELLMDVISNRSSSDDNEQAPRDHPQLTSQSPRDEVAEIIVLPKEKPPTGKRVKLDSFVKSQLSEYIEIITRLYRDNPFHNFQHACHVVMASRKLLSRVVKSDGSTASTTAYGITSDSLTQFAIVFSALIHDVDHPGVSNGQLVKEQTLIAVMYNNKSVAEQNSVTIAWDLLLEERFADLRYAIIPTESECSHFRKLLVNSVLATDLFDKDLKELRESRWSKAFTMDNNATGIDSVSDEDSNRRATIVIEHIIQAADVSHTMQHWHIYQKWNRKLLREMYAAYVAGRSEKDPTVGWYDGELWFFDNYIVPLAKKLKTCGVFGVSCDELLDYANRNRSEWARKGQAIVAEAIVSIQSQEFLLPGLSTEKFVLNAMTGIVQSFSQQQTECYESDHEVVSAATENAAVSVSERKESKGSTKHTYVACQA